MTSKVLRIKQSNSVSNLRLCGSSREANFLASESRDMFAEGDSNKTNEVFQETLAPSDFCNTGLEASGVNRYRWWRGLAQMTGFTLVFSKLAYLWTGGH
jgi:hypothetical protein